MINVMYCGNDRIFDGLIISSLSVCKKTKEAVNVYVLTMDATEIKDVFRPLTNEHAAFLESKLKKYNSDNRVILIDCKKEYDEVISESKSKDTIYTPYTLLRLLADKIEGLPSKILYLDTDTIANRDVSILYNMDITDYELAGVRDYLGKIFIHPNYINAGVLLLNLDMIKKTNLFGKAIHLINTKDMMFLDQDAINKSLTKKKIIDYRFNSQRRYAKEIVIQHFPKCIRLLPVFHTINVKPWMIRDFHLRLHNFHYDDILYEYESMINEFNSRKQ